MLSFRQFQHEPWTILAVYTKPTTGTTGAPPLVPVIDEEESVRRSDLYHISSSFSAKRLSIEEWAVNLNNPFAAGYDVGNCDDLKTYAYLDPFVYDSNSTLPIEGEIEIRPNVANENVTVFYIKKPAVVTQVTDTIEFPESVFSLLFNKALQYISYKQGDETNAYSVSSKDISLLTRTIL